MEGIPFTVHCLMNTQTHKMMGMGNICQETNPSINIMSDLEGEWSHMYDKESCKIIVSAIGTCMPIAAGTNVPNMNGTHMNGFQPTMNIKLTMYLDEDWMSGIACFQYLKEGKWMVVSDAKVKLMDESKLPDVKKLAQITKNAGLESIALN